MFTGPARRLIIITIDHLIFMKVITYIKMRITDDHSVSSHELRKQLLGWCIATKRRAIFLLLRFFGINSSYLESLVQWKAISNCLKIDKLSLKKFAWLSILDAFPISTCQEGLVYSVAQEVWNWIMSGSIYSVWNTESCPSRDHFCGRVTHLCLSGIKI